jgi:hypothetical protein
MFVTQEDIDELENQGVETATAIPTFIKELCEYFNAAWLEVYRFNDNVDSLEQLNKKYLHDYPSNQGYRILDDSFTCPDAPFDILSTTSKNLLGYFYGIYLHDDDV